MSQTNTSEFGPIRSFLWPIHSHESSKLIPMLIMLFLICFNYTILRNLKDSLVITSAGAEVIPFIKVWVLFPMAIVSTIIFTKLSNRFSQEKVFYIMVSGFLSIYALFAFILYPSRDLIHPDQSARYLETILPLGFKGLIAMYKHWTLTGFYVCSELWSTIILSVCFWGFANEVTQLSEARRFYSVFGIGSNFATIVASLLSLFLSQNQVFNPLIPFGQDAWEQTMMILVLVIIASGICVIGLFWWVNKAALTSPEFEELHVVKPAPRKKARLSLKESFSYLSGNKYLLCIAVLVVSYNLVINLVEVVWKDQLRALYPSPSDYNTCINNLSTMMGITSTIAAIFMARIISKLGWTKTALITPLLMLVTSLGFFIFLFFRNNMSEAVVALTGTTPLAIAVFFGSAQNCLSKASKYSFFDTTKEMAFIPLDHDVKLKGKAAIDGVGSRLGKSGGSLIHQSLLMIFGSLVTSAPFVAAILLGVIVLWIAACRSLGTQFNALAIQQRGDVGQEEEWLKEPAKA